MGSLRHVAINICYQSRVEMPNKMLYTWFILAFIVQIISAQFPSAIPEICRRAPPSVDQSVDCCTLPALIPESDYQQCNFKRVDLQRGAPGPLDCEKHMCILQRNNLTRSNGKIDPVSVNEFFDKWAASTSDPGNFRDLVNIAKEKCVGDALGANPSPCPAAKFLMCSSSVIFMKCPRNSWATVDGCKQLRDYFDQCSDILIKYF